MTNYRNDPNINNRRSTVGRTDNTALWAGGAIAAMLMIGLLAWGMSDNRNTVADNTNRPVATERSTTGSGATAPVTQRSTTGSGATTGATTAPPATNR